MHRTAKGFNLLAPVYSGLTKLIFAKSIERAQLHFLDCIDSTQHVLFLGGGSGEVLHALVTKCPTVKVDYVDLSPKMIDLAKRKTDNPDNVDFIIGTEKNIPDRTYTVVITNFYLDMFSDKRLKEVIDHIKPRLATNATWLATDFVSERVWHKVFLRTMYAFFKIVTGIQTHTLPDWQGALTKAGMQEHISKKFYRGFIKSSVYKIVE